MALWDLAGQAAGVPAYKLLGGKMRDRVRAYNGGVRFPMTGQTPQDYAENMAKMKESKEGFTLIKQAVGFHNPAMMRAVPNAWYDEPRTGASHPDRGLMTERGLKHVIACVEAMKKVLGDEIGLALDCGPGWTVKDAITFARALEPLHITWLEDIITGDYTPYPNAEVFREVTQSTSLPVHTGEQIYLRENFKDLIEKQAVNVIGPDPEDVGGLAELKWIAEYADLHGILVAPHGIFDGLIGLAHRILERNIVLRQGGRQMHMRGQPDQPIEDPMGSDQDAVEVGIFCDPLQFRQSPDVFRVGSDYVDCLFFDQILEVLPQVDLFAGVNRKRSALGDFPKHFGVGVWRIVAGDDV